MKIQHLLFGLLCFAFAGVSCNGDQPTPEPDPNTYYVMGNGKDDPTGTWMHGENWAYKSNNNQIQNGEITYVNVPAGEWLFKITNGTSELELGYTDVDAATSTPKYTEGEENRVAFKTLDFSNITIKLADKKITLLSTAPFILQDEYENRWPASLSIPEVGEVVKVEKAEFIMGSNNELGTMGPEHKVTFKKSFYMAKLEVTQKQYQAIVGNNPSEIQGDDLPVNLVNQTDVKKFIDELNKKTGRSFRLPTEAEWEFAAMGGKLSQSFTYAGSNNVEEVAWYVNNSEDDLQKGGLKKANELGLYDMSGNVSEWTSTQYESYTEEEVVDPGRNGSPYVVRGGAFDEVAQSVSSKYRKSLAGNQKFYSVGFRLVLDAPLNSELLPE